ncbi:hypothetical protein O0I10_005246 [Lichtheimia ornata]|uniref:AB hydrolase-1 domain-containing protein n=1 Tax=Lichtheimia ornata TaxID=688661 RepID=A0AAD7XVU0_9FUNG|nr:uncharacterized protein O0I10_005246 [Lichtheimia ornata]KAJ8658864.1 hypothetical protein O0I10_005246 [Lichtheimia ornata]
MALLRKLILSTVTIVALYTACVGLLCLPGPQRFMIFLNKIQTPSSLHIPESYGFAHNKIRNFQITTSDNITLGAWHILPSSYHLQHGLRDIQGVPETSVYEKALSDPKFETLVYFHGNAMNRAAPWRIDLYKRLSDKFDRLNIITIDYRGFGDSDGYPSESGLKLDAQAVIDWLAERNVPSQKITLLGHSLGTGVATTLASEMTAAGKPPKTLILKAAYSSLPNLIFEYRIFNSIPLLGPLQAFPAAQKWMLEYLEHKFDSASRIEHVQAPILIVYGATDLEIPGHNSHLLFHRAVQGSQEQETLVSEWLENSPKRVIPNEAIVYQHDNVRLVQLEYAGHNDVGYYDYTFQAMAEVTGWHMPHQTKLFPW